MELSTPATGIGFGRKENRSMESTSFESGPMWRLMPGD